MRSRLIFPVGKRKSIDDEDLLVLVLKKEKKEEEEEVVVKVVSTIASPPFLVFVNTCFVGVSSLCVVVT